MEHTTITVSDPNVDPAELAHEIWSVANPVAYNVSALNWQGHITGAQSMDLSGRFSESLEADFGGNAGVVDAFNATLPPEFEGDPVPTAAAVQRWAQALAKAKGYALQGQPADSPIEFEVITYLTM